MIIYLIIAIVARYAQRRFWSNFLICSLSTVALDCVFSFIGLSMKGAEANWSNPEIWNAILAVATAYSLFTLIMFWSMRGWLLLVGKGYWKEQIETGA